VSSEATSRRRTVPRIGDISPSCSNPAPLHKSVCRAPGYIVVFQSGVDATRAVAELQRKYNFSVKFIYRSLPGFASTTLTLQTVAALRCEPSVLFIEEDTYSRVDDASVSCNCC
jgi:hypothetical protein